MNKILIIHSHEDYQLAGALVHLIKNSFYGINRKNIICSSQIRRNPLENNSNFIRKYLSSANLTLGLLTEHSNTAPRVLFELGAAWKSNKVITLLGDKIHHDQIPGPLKEYDASRLDSKTSLLGLLKEIAKTCGYGEKKFSGVSQVIDNFLSGYPHCQSYGIPQGWSFLNWSTWGGIRALVFSSDCSRIVINGAINTAAGLVVKKQFNWEFKTLRLDVKGSRLSSFNQKKMFKLQINDEPLLPLEPTLSNANDPEYLNPGDNSFRYQLPAYVNKIDLIFYCARLNNFKIRGGIE